LEHGRSGSAGLAWRLWRAPFLPAIGWRSTRRLLLAITNYCFSPAPSRNPSARAFAEDEGVVLGQDFAGQRAIGELSGAQWLHSRHHAFKAGRAIDHQHPHALLGADLVWHARGDVDAGA